MCDMFRSKVKKGYNVKEIMSCLCSYFIRGSLNFLKCNFLTNNAINIQFLSRKKRIASIL